MPRSKFKIGIIGHFGFGLNLVNGQTIKTKIVSEVLSQSYNGKIQRIDTHGGIKAVIPVLLGCLKLLNTCDNVMILLTEKGISLTIPFLSICNVFFRKKMHYNVIGGWLPAFLIEHKWLIPFIKRFDYVYVETNTMKESLSELGINNCVIIPNCKNLNILNAESLLMSHVQPYKICTFSRVMKEKGIEDIVNTIIIINSLQDRLIYSLDIYGQIDNGQKEWFNNLKENFPSYIRYCGVIPYDNSVDVLKDYFALVFPTKFYTEGVPGTIIDAYASGLPVISSKWQSYADVIDVGKSGFVYKFNDNEELQDLLLRIANRPELILNQKRYCIRKAQNYTLSRLQSNLLKYID